MLNIHHNNMKAKIERQGSNEIPRFAVGAHAIAGASAASGATVQITFANNYISSLTGTGSFAADLTGDGINDMIGYHYVRTPGGAGINMIYLKGGIQWPDGVDYESSIR